MKTKMIFLWITAMGIWAAQTNAVEFALEDRMGIARQQEPVCSGIPFAKGELPAGMAMHVETADGQTIVTQTKELGHWSDGSVQWLLVQFLGNCPSKAHSNYVLKEGPSQHPSSLQVNRQADGIVVQTGTLEVRLRKESCLALNEVRQNGKVILTPGSRFVFELEDGSVHSSEGTIPDVLEIEESGPIRATVHVVGWLQDKTGNRLYKLDTRYRFYAGQSIMRMEPTFICLGQPELHRVKSIYMEIKPSVGSDPEITLPGEFANQSIQKGKTALLIADRNLVCRTGFEDSLAAADTPLQGWMMLEGKEELMGISIRNFYHLNPKAIEINPNAIRLSLWSERSGEILKLGRTRAKAHQILFYFTENAKERESLLARLQCVDEPLIAQTSPEYFCQTDAFGTLSPAGAIETADYDRKVRQAFEFLLHDRKTNPRENGMLHFGDYYHGGYGNDKTRGNLEYDTGHGCFLLYGRSGDRDYYNFAVDCNQHFIEMDDDHDKGGQRYHGYGERAERHEEVYTSTNWGHVFVDCCADSYYLTGDERSLEALRIIADDVAGIILEKGTERIRSKLAGAERSLGWPLLTLCRAYEVTRDPKYLQAAGMIIDYVKIYAMDPLKEFQQGVWWRTWMMDGCKPFMTGEFHNGLSAYYAITGDEELRGVIVKSLDWLIDHMWNPQENGFVYEFNAMNRKHRHSATIGLNFLIVDAFRYGYEMTGDERYLSVAVRAFSSRVSQLGVEDNGKQFSEDVRSSPHTAAYLQRKKIRSDSLPPSPQPLRQEGPPKRSLERPDILLHANFEQTLDCSTPAGIQKGEIIGDIQYVPGKKGYALAMEKYGFVRLPAPREMLMGPGSIGFWLQLHVKRDPQSPDQASVFHVEGQTPLIDTLGLAAIYDELRVRMKDHVGHLGGTAEANVVAWEPTERHHVVITWDEKRVKLYLDGVEQVRDEEGKYPGDSPIFLPCGNQTWINLGWRFGNWNCDCCVDELAIYGRALTQKEILEWIKKYQ